MSTNNKKVIQMPSMSLAPGDLKDGTPEWMREFVRQHGSTSPLKIERRRKHISANVDVLKRSIEKAQVFKKAALAETGRTINSLEAALKVEDDPQQKALGEQQLLALKWQKRAQEVELTDRVEQKMVNFSIVECLCLIVDSLTIRATVESKAGKKGFRRYSVAGMVSDVGVDTEYMVGLWRMIGKYLHPAAVPPEFDPESDFFRKDDEVVIDDEDILSDDEAKDIDRQAQIGEEDD